MGADIVGEEFSVGNCDLDAYVARAVEWINSPEARARAAKAQFERIKSMYSADSFIHQLCSLILALRKDKAGS